MKGLGRNVRYMLGKFHECLILMFFIFLLVFVLCNIGKENVLDRVAEEGPFYLLVVLLVLLLITISFGEGYYPTMVAIGSARKPAAWGMLLSQHIFLLEQIGILFIAAALIEKSKYMQVIRICPLGTVALLLFVLGIGLLINSISLSGYRVCAGILVFVSSGTAIALGIIMGMKCEFEINPEMFMYYNSLWILLIGLVVDLVGVVVYCKTVSKADIKLA